MTLRYLLAIAVLCLTALPACVNRDPAPFFADISYQVRCLDCTPIAEDNTPREIAAIDGENNFSVTCNAQTPGKDRVLAFSAAYVDAKHASNNYSIKMVQVDIDKSDPGSSCRVTIGEGSNTYEGHCTSGDPTDDLPCQVKLKQKGDVIKGTVLCRHIANRSDPSITRYVVAPNTESAAGIELHGCTGL